jgi:hypothetical protein
MKLIHILTSIIKEQDDIQGTSNAKFLDVGLDFGNFKRTIDSQINTARNLLVNTLSKKLVNKKVVARASKGTADQIEKDYTISIESIDVSQMGEKYHIIFKGTESNDDQTKDYYINISNKVKIIGDIPDTSLNTSNQSPETLGDTTPKNLKGPGFNQLPSAPTQPQV